MKLLRQEWGVTYGDAVAIRRTTPDPERFCREEARELNRLYPDESHKVVTRRVFVEEWAEA